MESPLHRLNVTNVSTHGFWLLIESREIFVPFEEFPWFREASIGQLVDVELQSPQHLFWPHLDVDLAVESLEHPDRYPLVSRKQHPKSRDAVTTACVNEDRIQGQVRQPPRLQAQHVRPDLRKESATENSGNSRASDCISSRWPVARTPSRRELDADRHSRQASATSQP